MPTAIRIPAALARTAVVAVCCLLAGGVPGRAAEPTVVAALGIDGYADIKKQLGWLGNQVGSPQLPALAESFVMMATQFKGLAGLDPGRPLGVVVTADEDRPVVHAYLPVKDLAKLLDVFKGMTGPVQEAGGKRILALPNGMRVEIAEQNGWAILSQEGSPAGPAAPEEIITSLVKDFSIGARLYPSTMPEGMQNLVRQMVEQAARQAAEQGQPVDPAAMALGLESLETVETITLGLALDEPGDRVFLESRTVMVPGSPAAAGWSAVAQSKTGLGLPAAADGKPAAARAHYTVDIAEANRRSIEATTVQMLPAGTGDPITDSLFGIFQDLLGAMLDAGGIDAGLVVDTSGADGDRPLPAVTLSARIKDGPALEKQVKNRLGNEGSLPREASVAFDAGKEAGANLHEITIDISGLPQAQVLGDKLVATLAVANDRAYLMLGSDARKQLTVATAAGKQPAAASEPVAGLDLSVGSLLGYAARMMDRFNPEDPAGEVLARVVEESAGKPDGTVAVTVRPIDRGGAFRLAVDGEALQLISSAVTATQTVSPLPGGGLPLPGAAAPDLRPRPAIAP
jgi:hypothetical protein